MRSIRVTVASNANRSLKSPLLISVSAPFDPISANSCHSLVLQLAQSKLRVKKPKRVFAAKGGRELKTAEDWQQLLRNDTTLLVSAGEEYVGKEDSVQDLAKLRLYQEGVTISNLSNCAYIEPEALSQLENTTKNLPGIFHAVVQPDLHPGNKYPVGAVFVSKKYLHPPLIGGDIGCGMAWYRTALTLAQVDGKKGEKVAGSLRGLEGPWKREEDRLRWLAASTVDAGGSPRAGTRFDASLGTIGAGNHFAELQAVEEVSESIRTQYPESQVLKAGEIILLVHSGSRGYGGDILKRYSVDCASTSMEATSEKAREYLTEHDRACAWAQGNRDLIALRFLACLEPSNEAWDLGINDSSYPSPLAITNAYHAIQARKVVDICHNNMERAFWSAASPSESKATGRNRDQVREPEEVWIHRKGAAPINPFHSSSTAPEPSCVSDVRTTLPILPLPGSRGTPTLILHPLLSEHNKYGTANAFSLAHGAGRAMSRAKAATYIASKFSGNADDVLRGDARRRNHAGVRIDGFGQLPKTIISETERVAQEVRAGDQSDRGGNGEVASDEGSNMQKQEFIGRQVHGGTWVICEDKALVWEEAPEAYKDVWDVGADLVAAGAAKRVGWCRSLVSYKVRK